MLRGLPASIIAHAAVFSASYLTFPYWGSANRSYATDFQAVDVSFAEIGEITNIAPRIEPEEESAAPEPEQPEELPEEDPVEEDLPEADQDITNVDEVAAETEPEDVLPDFDAQDPEDEPEQEPDPQPDPTPKPPRDPLADFLNQSESTFKSEIETRRKRPEPQPVPPEEQPKTALKNAPRPVESRNQRGAGERNANIARIDAILYSRIYPCWDGVGDLKFPERLNVRMKLQLNQNGTIADLTLVEPRRRPVGNSPMSTAVDRALKAVRKCAPYNLPLDDYDIWREGAVNLGPAFTPTTQR